MAENTQFAQIVIRIDAQRERADRARRLAEMTTDIRARENLSAYADQIDKEVQKLEAEIAVLKQAANDANPEASIAAFKPPGDSEPNG